MPIDRLLPTRCRTASIAGLDKTRMASPLRAGFKHHIERRLSCLAEARKSAAADHLLYIRGTGLRTQAKRHFLRERARHTHRRGRGVHDAPNRVQVRSDIIM